MNDILNASNQDVIEEIKKLQYIYKLKKVIRYNLKREEVLGTESVAEHVFGMFVLANYFLPLEDKEGKMDRDKVHSMMLYHDIDEIETGDIIGYLKTQADRDRELNAQKEAINNTPDCLKEEIMSLAEEYDKQVSLEARFVKAIDRIEPSFHCFNEEGREVYSKNKCTLEQHNSIKTNYVKDFPYIKKFNDVLTEAMIEDNFFYEA